MYSWWDHQNNTQPPDNQQDYWAVFRFTYTFTYRFEIAQRGLKFQFFTAKKAEILNFRMFSANRRFFTPGSKPCYKKYTMC
jgi:hypothetical protein